MRVSNNRHAHILMAWLMAVVIFMMPLTALAQGTPVKAPGNSYSVRDDVQLGRQAVAEAEQQLPILRDSEVQNYVSRVGERLVAAIPPQFQHREFDYFFKVVDARDINAFALPGGPMYVNRGMIEAARSEGEMAGVMAHEISHVALRHGTAQAGRGQKAGIGAAAGAILGGIIGGPLGGVIAQGTQFGLGAYLLKYNRTYERDADTLGAQIMARAGYDPRDLANMFATIERQSGGRGGPEWLSSHPNPGNRQAAINREAQLLRVNSNGATQDTREFQRIQSRLRGYPRARSMEEIARSGERYPHRGGSSYPEGGRMGGRVEYPSSRYRTYTEGNNYFRVSVPENWRELPSRNTIWFAPEGAYGQVQGQAVFTHGVEIGVSGTRSNDLRSATDDFINALTQGNPNLRLQRGYQSGTIDGRRALAATLYNRNEATGQTEVITIYTTMVRGGGLFHMIAVAPQDEFRNYQGVFQNILRSIQLNG